MSDLGHIREPGEFISTSRNDSHIVDYLNELFQTSARDGYSDIHIEDADAETIIRRRLNGTMKEYMRITKQEATDVQDKIRKKAKISTAERRSAKDGNMFLIVDDRIVDIRVNIYPTRSGHSIVCRLLDQENAQRQLDEVEMLPKVRESVDRILYGPEGMLIVSGPTGSGKTSTLYAALNLINTPERKIITAEDPVEYRLPGLIQGPITNDMTFAQALRAMMRQDPDVVLLGEIRDAETARTATEMSLTGHLVLSTIHANDCAATVTRLLDLGVISYNLGTSLKGVLAQRLARRLCDCAIRRMPNEFEKHWIERYDIEDQISDIYDANDKGCEKCTKGFKGRIPVISAMLVDAEMAKLINERRPTADFESLATQQSQYETLAKAATRLCREGKLPMKEAIRIGGTDRLEAKNEENACV
jgi:type II secretory ATPase GspE/PulE/Tfp pilus assembly ATPase PilB-like protein